MTKALNPIRDLTEAHYRAAEAEGLTRRQYEALVIVERSVNPNRFEGGGCGGSFIASRIYGELMKGRASRGYRMQGGRLGTKINEMKLTYVQRWSHGTCSPIYQTSAKGERLLKAIAAQARYEDTQALMNGRNRAGALLAGRSQA